MIQSINPATAAVIATYEAHTPDQVNEALTGAVTAQAQWRKRPVEERVTLLTEQMDETVDLAVRSGDTA